MRRDTSIITDAAFILRFSFRFTYLTFVRFFNSRSNDKNTAVRSNSINVFLFHFTIRKTNNNQINNSKMETKS